MKFVILFVVLAGVLLFVNGHHHVKPSGYEVHIHHPSPKKHHHTTKHHHTIKHHHTTSAPPKHHHDHDDDSEDEDDDHKHHHEDHHHSQKSYKFEYGVKDPHTGDHKSQWEIKEGDKVRGAYMLYEPDGTKRIVEYTADKHNGFNAVVKRIGHAKHPHQHEHEDEDEHEHEHEH